MTRIERLSSVIELGLLSDNEVRRRLIAGGEIGYPHVKERRARREVPCGAGGSLGDYVPFYFAPRSPMLYAITRGRVSDEAARTEEIVYLQSSTQQLRHAGVHVVASNRHPVLAYAEFSDADEVLEGDNFVDWPLMGMRYWNNTEQDPDRKDRRQAECLAFPTVPWSLIERVVAKNNAAAERVRNQLLVSGTSTPIEVRPDWYF